MSYLLGLLLAAVLSLSGTKGEVVPRLVGCFSASSADLRFILTGFQNKFRGLTLQQCNTLCFNKGFIHAATKSGDECYCGDFKSLPEPSDMSLCDVSCSDEGGEYCGGKNAFSIHTTGIEELDVEELEVGCLTDHEDVRLLHHHKVDMLQTNTPERCVAYCKALGYRHAGVQYQFECYCGEADRLNPIVDGCDLPCVGDKTKICGGNWKMNVYYTGVTKPTPVISSKGCYHYNATYFTRRKTIPDLTPNRCVSNCYSIGAKFATLYKGEECLCGTRAIPSHQRAKLVECSTPCPGAKEESCGGPTFVHQYTTSIVGDPMLGKLIGCYKDENSDLIRGPKLNLGVDNRPGTCITRCIELGFPYAGLKNTYECHCTFSSPKRTPVKIVPDYECNLPCPVHNTESCGTPLNMALYRTGLDQAAKDECAKSLTQVNGKKVCAGKVLFSDDFDKLDLDKWHHTLRMSGENEEFVTYVNDTKNIFIENGTLVIKPTVLEDDLVKYGHISIPGCTGEEKTHECERQASSYKILPPVESAQICTRKSFNFKYGVITIDAKVPRGDWVYPQIWLRPVQESYGKGYPSGQMTVALVRGNTNLLGPDGSDIGNSIVHSGVKVSTKEREKMLEKVVPMRGHQAWPDQSHVFAVSWTTDTLLFYRDNNVLGLKTIFTYLGRSLTEDMGFFGAELNTWKNGTVLAPFDQEFYVCLGVGVGGFDVFPDGSVSSGTVKPWSDYTPKSMLQFWKDKKNWLQTWSNETRFVINSISITAH